MHRRALTVLTPALVLAATLGMAVDTAFAADCGDGVGACSCGDTVITDTTLVESFDPVCSTGPADTCPDTGLFVATDVVLSLGGCTIRGGTGSLNGVDASQNAEVRSGKISGFGGAGVRLTGNGGVVANLQISDGLGAGISVVGHLNRIEKSVIRRQEGGCVVVNGDGNTLSNLQALDCGFHGVAVEGSFNSVQNTKALRNALVGIVLFGDDNTTRISRAEDNGTDGIAGGGDNLVLARNTALRNGQCGVRIFQAPSTSGGTSSNGSVDRNQAKSNDLAGVCVEGTGHTVSLNIGANNGVAPGVADGIRVFNTATGNTFVRNRGTGNADFGIEDTSVGGGTSGTANTYTGNICSANGTADSSPAGLCR
jgi:hypothetical protein